MTARCDDLIAVLARVGRPRVLVVGDVMLDRYWFGEARRISPEAPVPVLQVEREEIRLGGAANVAHLLAVLGADAHLAGVVGADAEGARFRRELIRAGIDGAGVVVDDARPTTVKQRLLGGAHSPHAQQMLRIDCEVCRPLPKSRGDKLKARVEWLLERSDLVLLSDYDKGVCQGGWLRSLVKAAFRKGRPVLVDPARLGDYARYRGASLITPNRSEAELAGGAIICRPNDALAVGARICRRWAIDAAAITPDRDGIALSRSGSPGQLFPTRPRAVYDVTGAGDMVLAMLGLCLASGASCEDAVRLANVAAGLEVERLGATPVRRGELLAELEIELAGGRHSTSRKVCGVGQLLEQVEVRKQRGETIVFTNGCFDLLHPGHVAYLEQAAKLGDCLVVAVNSDRTVRLLKGPGRPVNSADDRACVLAALGCVDYVTVFDQPTPHALLDLLRPNVLVKGGTYTLDQVAGSEIVEHYGGTIHVMSLVPERSTSRMIERVVAGTRHDNACV